MLNIANSGKTYYCNSNVLGVNLVITLAIYWGLTVLNFIQIRLNLTFLLYDV